jgi:alkanesulfonate monooxygenase SsuD/methylene tetrahydromethanopterin reductase-like flavin-dependent oxidoreductase (luciferase family)
MLDNCSPDRLRTAINVAQHTLTLVGRKPADLVISVGLLVFIHERITQARDAARRNLARYAMLPAYNRLFARSGFAAEAGIIAEAARRNDSDAAAAAINDRMVDNRAIAGPPELCRERVAEYRQAGAPVVVLRPNPVAEDYVSCIHKSLQVFASMS